MGTLRDADPDFEYRQVAVLDRRGDAACHTGTNCRDWAGHLCGPGYIACGNVLQNVGVVQAIANAFVVAPELALAERLLRGIEAGRDAGGQVGGTGHLPERSASLLVHATAEDHALIDLRVDGHSDAVTELRRLFDEFEPYTDFHEMRWRAPSKAVPQEHFVASLSAKAG
jgi:uncharacterized Ntn-hydrolase superfamily protein